jgi:hypothetical protein
MAHGNLPLWNPHQGSGIPFAGAFQPALFYPPNLLYLVLSTGNAINTSLAFHFFLAAMLMFLWARQRGLQGLPSLLAGLLYATCAPLFLPMVAGHLTTPNVLAWAPLVMMSVDGTLHGPRTPWALAGMLAVALQVLGGVPQFVFFQGIAVGLYAALHMVQGGDSWTGRARSFLAMASMYAGGAALAAVQLLLGASLASESTRTGGGLSEQFGMSLSLPPENLFTLLAPRMFGDEGNFPYWGRWYFWEACAFFGVTTLLLAALAVRRDDAGQHPRRLLALCVVLLMFALGGYTPVFPFLFNHVPGFNVFRVPARFTAGLALPLCILAAAGLQSLMMSGRSLRAFSLVTGVAGTALLVATQLLEQPLEELLRSLDGGTGLLRGALATQDGFPQRAAAFAQGQLVLAAAVLLVAALIFLASSSAPRAAGAAMLALATLEMCATAGALRFSFKLEDTRSPQVEAFFQGHPGDARVLMTGNPEPDSAAVMGLSNIAAYDPAALRRYAEFIAWTQGRPLDGVDSNLSITTTSPALAMLRLGFVVEGSRVTPVETPPLHTVEFVPGYRVVRGGRDAVFGAMGQAGFDPRGTVVLEAEPDLPPGPLAPLPAAIRVDVQRPDSDTLVIDAELPAPGILLVTESHSSGWVAHALPSSTQQRYQVLPANHALRAVPVNAGTHHLVMTYAPRGYVLGCGVSLTSSCLWLLAAWWLWKRGARLIPGR